MGDELLGLIVITAWSIWFNWNATRTGKTRQPAAAILHKARALVEEFWNANLVSIGPVCRAGTDPGFQVRGGRR